MSQDVRQWLAEIKLLQEKVAALQQERDAAYASAANWRNLYETEAKQRRTEANLARQMVEDLQSQLQQLHHMPAPTVDNADNLTDIQAQVEQIQEISELKASLIQTRLECDRYIQALKAEQVAHAQTRKALTTALGDTMDVLTRERTARKKQAQAKPKPVDSTNGNGNAGTKGAASSPKAESAKPRNPSLELPQFE